MKTFEIHRRSEQPALVAAAALIFVLAAGCRKGGSEAGLAASSQAGGQSGAAVVLKVGDTEYTRADFDKYVQGVIGNGDLKLEALSLSRLFDEFVDQKILLRGALGQGVSLTSEEKQILLDNWNRSVPQGAAGRILTMEGMNQFFDNRLVEKYIGWIVKDLKVGDDEIEQYFEAHASEFRQPERMQISQILLKSKEKAEEVLGLLKNATEEEFRTQARLISVGPEASAGGMMGVFKASELPRDIEKTAFSLKEGELSRVVKTDFGYHIFRADKILDAEQASKEKAADSIRRKILEEKITEAKMKHLRQLKEGQGWSSYPERLPFAYQRDNT